MKVDVRAAIAFVNSHAPIYAQNVSDRTFVIHFEEVDMDGKVSWASEAVGIKDGKVDLKSIRDLLGY